jgi:hypothetical protein
VGTRTRAPQGNQHGDQEAADGGQEAVGVEKAAHVSSFLRASSRCALAITDKVYFSSWVKFVCRPNTYTHFFLNANGSVLTNLY